MQEIWKPLKGLIQCGDYYEVSNFGRVRSLDKWVNSRNGGRTVKGKIMKHHFDKDGYCRITLTHEGKHKGMSIHQLVAIIFIDNPDNKPTVNHKDGIITNNHVDNLEWATHSEQTNHAIETGLLKLTGEDHHQAILTEKQVIEIYSKYRETDCTLENLADEYGVSLHTISLIKTGKSWKHLGLEPYKRPIKGGYVKKERPSITQEVIDEILRMYDEGCSIRSIESKMNVDGIGLFRAKISSILKESGRK